MNLIKKALTRDNKSSIMVLEKLRKGSVKMKYQINLNGSYINSFKTYSEALEVKENLLRRFPKVRVEIISIA